MLARCQRRPYSDLRLVPEAHKELVIQVTLSAVSLKATHIWTERGFAGVMDHTVATMNHKLSSAEFVEASKLLPRTYKAALTMLMEEKTCVWNRQIHYQMCIHCNFVFRCKYKDAKVCPCGHARTPQNICKLIYMPASGHMVNAYGVVSVAKSMGSWWERRTRNPNMVRDSTDLINPFGFDPTKARKDANDPRHWMITHIQDPFAPYKDDMFYSCSPSLMHVLNLPAWVRQKLGYAHLLSIGPGTRKRSVQPLANNVKKTDRHQHAIFADELVFLDLHGIEVYDAYKKEYFYCKARLVNCVSDLRGMEKLIGISSTPARYGCLHCWWEGFRVGGKTLYCGHQAMLPEDDPLRRYLRDRNGETLTKKDIENPQSAEYIRKTAKQSVKRQPCHKRCHAELVTCWPGPPAEAKPLVVGESSVVQLGESCWLTWVGS